MTEPTRDALIEACREELECLWSDLSLAQQHAINGVWSIQCEQVQHRIETLTKLVGPTRWEAVQWDLLESGVYQRIHAGLGIEVHPDMGRVAEGRARQAATRLT